MSNGQSKVHSHQAGAWTIHCDGTALKGRGATGFGAVLKSPSGQTFLVSQAGAVGCNTQAEGWAFIAALEEAKRLGARVLAIFCDNAVVIEQTVGEARTQVPRLVPLFAQARALLASFDAATVQWVPRHKNVEADALARAALGLAHKP